MKNLTATAQTETAQKAKGRQMALATFGLVIDNRPAVFSDLTNFQINEAIDGISFVVKGSKKQQELGLIADLTQDALLDMLDGSYVWDSTLGSFYLCLKIRVKQLLFKNTSKTSTQREAQSYSGTMGTDGEEIEFSYATAELSPLDAMLTAENKVINNPLAKFTTKELQYVDLLKVAAEYKRRAQFNKKHKIVEVLEVFGSKEMAKAMNCTDGAFRKWVSLFKTKHGYNDAIDAQISKSGLRKRASK